MLSRFVGLSCLAFFSTACKTHQEVGASSTWLGGHPSTSDDGLEWVFIEIRSSDTISFPPLQGWTARGNYRFRLMRGTDLNNAEAISDFYKGHALHAFDMHSAGYSVVNYLIQPEETRGGIVFDEEGDELLHINTTELPLHEQFFMVPSPDAQSIAVIVRNTDWESYQNGVYSNQIYIAFYDTQTFSLQSSSTHSLAMGVTNNNLPPYAWSSNTTLLLSDYNSIAWEIDTNNNISEIDVPDCLHLPTTSGRYHADNDEYLSPNSTRDTIVVDPSFVLPLPLCE